MHYVNLGDSLGQRGPDSWTVCSTKENNTFLPESINFLDSPLCSLLGLLNVSYQMFAAFVFAATLSILLIK